MVKLLVRLEGVAVLGFSLFYFDHCGFSWPLFAYLFLTPDLALLGYARGREFGSWVYNLTHSYIIPLALLATAIHFNNQIIMACGLIWTAHVGFDRMIGFGLKYPTGFFDTHLQRL